MGFLVHYQYGGMVGEGVFIFRGRVVAVAPYCSQVWFFLRLVWLQTSFVGGTGWVSVTANCAVLHSLGFSPGKIRTYVSTGPYFDDSHKESSPPLLLCL